MRGNKIRILYTIPNFDTAGSGRLLISIAEKIDPSLFEVQICCFNSNGEFFKTVEGAGFPIHLYPFATDMSKRWKGFLQVLKIAAFLRSLNVDIVHSFHYSSDYSEAMAARLTGCKWVYTKKNMSWRGKSRNGWRLRTFLANAIIAQNSDMLNTFFLNQRKVVMIPSGVDLTAFSPRLPDISLREEFGTSAEKRIVITVANFVPVKGIEILIKAFSQVALRYREWILWLVGDHNNEYGEYLVGLSHALSMAGRIQFLGKQKDVRKFLDHAEIFVIPTLDEGRREGSPVALLEAMANEKLVLASAVPGIADQLREFPEHLFHPGNSTQLAEKLDYWMREEKGAIRARGKELGEHTKQNYSMDLIGVRHEEFYQTVMGRK